MDKSHYLKYLRDLSDHIGLHFGDDILKEVMEISTFREFPKGSTIARTGDSAKYSGITLRGVVRSCYIDRDGNDITSYFASEGRLCMDEGMLGFDRILSVWEAVEGSTVMIFEAKQIKDLILCHEHMKTIWIGLLEDGMRYKIYRENAFLTENATERYLQFRKDYPELAGRVPQRYIATYLGIKPESLSRIKATLKESITE